MKKLFIILMLVLLCGCQKETNLSNEAKTTSKQDFWQAIIKSIESKSDETSFSLNDLEIRIQDPNYVEDKNHRGLSINKSNNSETTSESISFILDNINEKSLSYVYTFQEKNDNDETKHVLNIKTTDKKYQEYQLSYTCYQYSNNQQIDETSALGNLTINNEQISYDNMPYLKETLSKSLDLLNEFQKAFDIDLETYDFVNLPKIADKFVIESSKTIDEQVATTLDYRSKPYSNAKGYMLESYLKVDKEYTSIEFGEYNIDRQSYDSKTTATLKPRDLENCYDIIQKNDPDVQYSVYFKNDKAYMYLQSISDTNIINDVNNNNGASASSLLEKK